MAVMKALLRENTFYVLVFLCGMDCEPQRLILMIV